MTYLESYLESFVNQGKNDQARSIEKTATKIGEEYLSKFDFSSNQTGLLFGNIQSGKTGQMFGVASEAVDRGFSYFLLLETDSNLLQKQTYERAKKDLPNFVVCDENEEQKFLNHGSLPVMIVIKKNGHVLKSWADRLKNSQKLKGNPLFILDDEADAASLNTKQNQREQSTINKYLESIKDLSLSSMYLQVTGTPQAILLQKQDSQWRPMFTYYFSPGKGYLGGDFFFPDTEEYPDFIRFIDNDDSEKSIRNQVLRHLVVSAQVLLSGESVSNCLIHPGIKTETHIEAKRKIESALSWLNFNHNDEEVELAMKKEFVSINPTKNSKKSYDAIKDKIFHMLEERQYSIITLNGKSDDSSKDYKSGCNFIIGGTNLGRGVTFGQLNTFIYTRTSQIHQADTMWQHSRMFGYDRDPGLITMYITHELYKLFVEINNTNRSIVRQATSLEEIKIGYISNIRPTRSSVLNKEKLNIMVGGSNHFPINPICSDADCEKLNHYLDKFNNNDGPTEAVLKLLINILELIKTEKSFNMSAYISMMKALLVEDPLAKGKILVRRDRDVVHAGRALLSQNDWEMTNKYKNEFVLTMYQVIGSKEKGWGGNPVWVPNIKLPMGKDFYII